MTKPQNAQPDHHDLGRTSAKQIKLHFCVEFVPDDFDKEGSPSEKAVENRPRVFCGDDSCSYCSQSNQTRSASGAEA